ncbi:methionyl-tRNA formyltransferase [Patescibacteria group bacterium]|nr:methionyl-tRNA formyltransferase [Patescibacteria group bacterium]
MENTKIAYLGKGRFGEAVLEELGSLNLVVLNDHNEIKITRPGLVIVASYGKIIPKDVLNIPKYGVINIHPSLLPKYRGASPIQTAILNSDKMTGISIMLMDEKMDHGAIISNIQYPISQNYTYKELEKQLAVKGAQLLIEILPKWIDGKIKAKEQDHKEASYTKVFKREDGEIDWKKTPEEIDSQVRAFNPWPGTYTIWRNKRIKILETEVIKDKLIIKKIQPEGKKPMAMEDFLRGHHGFNPLL